LLEQAGFVAVATERDLEDRDRVSLGRRSSVAQQLHLSR
jgi:hypothetical protein